MSQHGNGTVGIIVPSSDEMHHLILMATRNPVKVTMLMERYFIPLFIGFLPPSKRWLALRFNHQQYHPLDSIGILDAILTPPKTNMEPQNEGLEAEFPFKWGEFQVPPVSFGGSIPFA